MKDNIIHSVLYLFVVALFFAIIGDTLLTTGLFVDGLVYADVANNMAHGIGSFWHPTYTLTQFTAFYEHPPLAMGMLSLFFRVFGDGVWVVRLYSMLMTLLTALLTLQLWKQLGFNLKMGWLPLLFWTLVPAVTLNSHENMLECTMAVFVVGSVVAMLRGGWKNMLVAGIMLAAAFLTKGFVGLYPLALPFLLFLTRRRDYAFTRSGAHAFGIAVHNTLLVLGTLVAVLSLVCLASRDAWPFLSTYIDHQVVESIQSDVVGNRFYIVGKFFEETVIVWCLVVVGIVLELRRCHGDPFAVPNLPQLPLLLLTLCGVLPIMVSGKQRSFYLLTVYPFLSVAVAAGVCRQLEHWCGRATKGVKIGVGVVACALAVFAVVHNANYYGKPGRDIAMQEDLKLIAPLLEEDEMVSVGEADRSNYSLQGYYWQARRVSLTTQYGCRHFLTGDPAMVERLCLDTLYHQVPLTTQQYQLFEKVDDYENEGGVRL